MSDFSLRSLAATALGALAFATAAAPGAAQTGTFYTPPKIIKQGTATSPVVGTGSVTVQVFVRKDGSVGTVKVEKSTNHGDDAAATEIAKSSTYKPGVRDARPIDAYYTLALKFENGAVTTDTGSTVNDVNQANALVRAGKYDDAKTELQAYLIAHPGDKDAEALLGVSDYYLKDNAGAVAALDAAGTIPDRFKTVAAQAYYDAAVDALTAKNNDQSVAYASKSLALQPNATTLFVRGTAYANAQKYAQAVPDLENAKAQATAAHADAKVLNSIDASLATTYIMNGDLDKGRALGAALKQRDPSSTRVDDALVAYYVNQASTAMQAGKKDDAVAALDKAAQSIPSRAVSLYLRAADMLSQGTTVDWKRVKAEVDKALAIAPNNAQALYFAGIALANGGDPKGGLAMLQKAKANAGSDAALNTTIDTAVKKLTPKQ